MLLLAGAGNPAFAHSFGQTYSLPIPFALYGWGGVAALALSFAIAAFFLRRGHNGAVREHTFTLQNGLFTALLRGLQVAALGSLLLCIVAGFVGKPHPYVNINMTLFWIVFVLGFAYLTAIVGGLYAQLNPWQNLVKVGGKIMPVLTRGLFTYHAERYGYWPAIGLYMGFIWLELFGRSAPASLAWVLLAYTGVNVLGSVLWGVKNWFRYGEFFSVFLRLFALAAPLHYVRDDNDYNGARITLCWPFAGLLREVAEHHSLVVFILFMLSSTAFDGLHETVPWQRFFWSTLLPALDPDVVNTGLRAIITHRSWYNTFQWGSLVLSPFVYLAAYWLALWLGKKLARSSLSMGELARRFAFSLLPIALVYHVTHYYTLLLTQGIKVIRMLSDPFGWQWDLFGTAGWFKYAIIPDVATVWHVQVVTIVIGHIISVYIAHVEALRIFGDHKQATLSQLPMLLLMMAFTTAGLWILAQPIQTGL